MLEISFQKRIVYGLFIVAFAFCFENEVIAQSPFTRADTLRGSITPERGWWDLNYYHLSVEVFPETKSIKGTNLVRYKVTSPHQVMQIDLQEPLKITSVTQEGETLEFKREGAAHFITLKKKQVPGTLKRYLSVTKANPRKPCARLGMEELPGPRIKMASTLSLHPTKASVRVFGGHPKTILRMRWTAC
jgi:hypothetical protein